MADAPPHPAAGQARQKSTIRRSERRPFHLTAQHRDLVAQDNDLDGELVAIEPAKSDELKDSEEGEVAERESHNPSSPDSPGRRKPRSSDPDDILGTNKADPGSGPWARRLQHVLFVY